MRITASIHRGPMTGSISSMLCEVFYGNVGSRERLDFTVIGPAAVNLD
jgi:hypothetical protein